MLFSITRLWVPDRGIRQTLRFSLCTCKRCQVMYICRYYIHIIPFNVIVYVLTWNLLRKGSKTSFAFTWTLKTYSPSTAWNGCVSHEVKWQYCIKLGEMIRNKLSRQVLLKALCNRHQGFLVLVTLAVVVACAKESNWQVILTFLITSQNTVLCH